DKITRIDPVTGRTSDRAYDRLAVYPRTHYVTPRQRLMEAMENLRVELDQRVTELRANDRLLEAQRLSQRTLFDLEMIAELGYCNGIENYSRHLSGRRPGEPPPTLIDYFPEDFLLVVDESHQTIPQVRGMWGGDRSRKETLVEYGFRLPSAIDNRPLSFDEFQAKLGQILYISATPAPYELEKAGGLFAEQVIRPTGLLDPELSVRPVKGQVDDLIGVIKERTARSERVMVTTLTKRMAEDLTRYLMELGIKVNYLHSDIETLEFAIDETNRRRAIQQKYNEEHDIEPASIIKAIDSDLVKMANLDYFEIPGGPTRRPLDLAADEDIDKTISRLTKEMKEAAKNLDFEKAAEIRDRVRELKEIRIFV